MGDLFGGVQTEQNPHIHYFASIGSSEPVNPNRYSEIALEFFNKILNGKTVTIITHSFGAIEFVRMAEELEKLMDSDSENTNFDKIKLVLLSPYGLIEKAAELFKLLRFNHIIATMLPGYLASLRKGIESLLYLTPEGIESQDLETAVSQAFSGNSASTNDSLNLPTIPTLSDESYFHKLPEEKQQEIKNTVAELDQRLVKAIEQKRWIVVKWLLKKRGKLLQAEIAEAYQGEAQPTPGQSALEMYKVMAQANLGILRILELTAGGKALRMIKDLKEKGAQLQILVPEFDAIISINELCQALNIGKREAGEIITILATATHSSIALNPAGLDALTAVTHSDQ